MTEKDFESFYKVLSRFWAKSEKESEINLISSLILGNSSVFGRYSEAATKLVFQEKAAEQSCVFFLLRINVCYLKILFYEKVLFHRTLQFHKESRLYVEFLVEDLIHANESAGSLKL